MRAERGERADGQGGQVSNPVTDSFRRKRPLPCIAPCERRNPFHTVDVRNRPEAAHFSATPVLSSPPLSDHSLLARSIDDGSILRLAVSVTHSLNRPVGARRLFAFHLPLRRHRRRQRLICSPVYPLLPRSTYKGGRRADGQDRVEVV